MLIFLFDEVQASGQDLSDQLFLTDARGFTTTHLAEAQGKIDSVEFLKAKALEYPAQAIREAVTSRGPVSLRLLDPDLNEKDM